MRLIFIFIMFLVGTTANSEGLFSWLFSSGKEITAEIKLVNKCQLDSKYFIVRDLDKDLKGLEQSVAHGKVVSMIGDQITRGTPVDKQKSGKIKMMFPNLGTGYYYSLSNWQKSIEKRFRYRLIWCSETVQL